MGYLGMLPSQSSYAFFYEEICDDLRETPKLGWL